MRIKKILSIFLATAMALTAHDLFSDSDKTKRIVQKFKEMKAAEGK